MKKIYTILFFVLISFVLSCQMTDKNSGSDSSSSGSDSSSGSGNAKLEEINPNDFSSKVKSEDSGVVCFMASSSTCSNSSAVEGFLKEIAKKSEYSKITFYITAKFFVTGQLPQSFMEFKKDAQSVNAYNGATSVVVIYQNGTPKKGFSSYKSAEEIESLLKSFI